jgi:hypothetical protein
MRIFASTVSRCYIIGEETTMSQSRDYIAHLQGSGAAAVSADAIQDKMVELFSQLIPGYGSMGPESAISYFNAMQGVLQAVATDLSTIEDAMDTSGEDTFTDQDFIRVKLLLKTPLGAFVHDQRSAGTYRPYKG